MASTRSTDQFPIMFHVEHCAPRYWFQLITLFSTWISTVLYPALAADNWPLNPIVPRGTAYLSTPMHKNQALSQNQPSS
jgi:hypothetical protein